LNGQLVSKSILNGFTDMITSFNGSGEVCRSSRILLALFSPIPCETSHNLAKQSTALMARNLQLTMWEHPYPQLKQLLSVCQEKKRRA